ncbi:unnamed protein product [marine sediment metagenome]|uniref:Uncharacterized protein n=1 Tax=marine sediment metagenome TaxID=412755 RepID=X1GGH1_9ZZZZ
MNQNNTMVEVLSGRRAGSKLKRISIEHSPYRERHSQMSFIFTGARGRREERVISIYGKDLQLSFGRRKL